jgi:hypothetical protein
MLCCILICQLGKSQPDGKYFHDLSIKCCLGEIEAMGVGHTVKKKLVRENTLRAFRLDGKGRHQGLQVRVLIAEAESSG